MMMMFTTLILPLEPTNHHHHLQFVEGQLSGCNGWLGCSKSNVYVCRYAWILWYDVVESNYTSLASLNSVKVVDCLVAWLLTRRQQHHTTDENNINVCVCWYVQKVCL